MRLPELQPHERTYFLELVARGSSIKHATESLYKLYPDAHEYSYNAFVQWVRSEEGKGEVEDHVEGIRSAALERSFANRLSRIDVLTEIAEKLVSKMRQQLELGEGETLIFDKTFFELSKELRQYLKQLQEETAPLDDMGKNEQSSVFERFMLYVLERKDRVLADAAEVIELPATHIEPAMGDSEPVPATGNPSTAQ